MSAKKSIILPTYHFLLLSLLQEIHNSKKIAVLIDPDQEQEKIIRIATSCANSKVDIILVGGSLTSKDIFKQTIASIKSVCNIPIYIFPGNEFMIDDSADGILFLSLLSGRNPEYLIGKQVIAAPILAKSQLEVIPTAYLLIDGGRETSVSYISNTKPIPADKSNIALATALAGKMMGMQCVYMDAGSGAFHSIPPTMVQTVAQGTQLPIIIGGGIRSGKTAQQLFDAGANLVVVGNGVEENLQLIEEIQHTLINKTSIINV